MTVRRSLVGILVALVLLAGCADRGRSPQADQNDAPVVPNEQRNRGGRVPGQEPPPAVPRKVIGGVGESSKGCELPVRFMMTGQWNPRPARPTAPAERADMTLICEIDAPSGPGMLRIWIGSGPDADPRSALRAFMAASSTRAEGSGGQQREGRGQDAQGRPGRSSFARLVADDVTGWQVTHPRTVEAGQRRESAFALPIPRGVLLVSMGPLPAKRYDELLPVYVLAKTTVKVTN